MTHTFIVLFMQEPYMQIFIFISMMYILNNFSHYSCDHVDYIQILNLEKVSVTVVTLYIIYIIILFCDQYMLYSFIYMKSGSFLFTGYS